MNGERKESLYGRYNYRKTTHPVIRRKRLISVDNTSVTGVITVSSVTYDIFGLSRTPMSLGMVLILCWVDQDIRSIHHQADAGDTLLYYADRRHYCFDNTDMGQ
ncbi:MAG: hypothetical protein GY702_20905 [Desulfobulbaceae bacterium]|nr:hypothetical protein [Desulfobulbaceae bacterium]